VCNILLICLNAKCISTKNATTLHSDFEIFESIDDNLALVTMCDICDIEAHVLYHIISGNGQKFGVFWYMSHFMSQMMSCNNDIISVISRKFVIFWYWSHYVTSVTYALNVTVHVTRNVCG
jgi:hypothetical protein